MKRGIDISEASDFPVERLFKIIFPLMKRIVKITLGLEPKPSGWSDGLLQEIIMNSSSIKYFSPAQGTSITNDQKLEIWSKNYFECVSKNLDNPMVHMCFLELTNSCLPMFYLLNNPDAIPSFADILWG